MSDAVATIAGAGVDPGRAPGFAVPQALVLRDMVRYGVCSVASLALDWGVLVGLVHAGVPTQVAAATGFLLGMALSYALSVSVVYNGRRHDPPLKEAAIFAAIGIAGLCLNQAAIWLLSTRLGIDPGVAKAPTCVLVFFFNFFLRRSMLFSPAPAGRMPE